MRRVLKRKKPKTVNDKLEKLERNQEIIDDIKKKTKKIQTQITDSFQDCVIMFVDLVDSTKFKQEHDDSEWVLRVKQFVDVISEYANDLSGEVVKIIGDEVMIAFNRQEMLNDAIGFAMRVSEIEDVLKTITKFETRIKIALDIGSVCFLKYEGHDTPDPQGTPVDRCARISKYCKTSTVLTSEFLFGRVEHKGMWNSIGKPHLKGIGNVAIYQMGKKTLKAENSKTISESEYNNLTKARDEVEDLKKMNISLQKQVRMSGAKPQTLDCIDTGKEDAWKDVEVIIQDIRKLIDKAPVYSNSYARFLFLNETGNYDEYNKFEGKTFDDVIEAGFVYSPEENNYFGINTDNKRNQKIINKLHKLQEELEDFVAEYGELDEEDLFDYSTSSPEFWENYIGYNVL